MTTNEDAIAAFSGDYRWLSNFWPVPLVVRIYGNEYRFSSVEHAYQASKAVHPADITLLQNAPTAGKVKRLGNTIKKRPDWDTIKLGVMDNLLRKKFTWPMLGKKLIATHPRQLIEGNTWGDTYWGVCNGVGENHLGRLLMAIRLELINEPE